MSQTNACSTIERNLVGTEMPSVISAISTALSTSAAKNLTIITTQEFAFLKEVHKMATVIQKQTI